MDPKDKHVAIDIEIEGPAADDFLRLVEQMVKREAEKWEGIKVSSMSKLEKKED